MRWYKRLSLAAALAVAALGSAAVAAERASREAATFGVLTPPSETAIKVQAAGWLKEAGKYDANRQPFDAIWADKDTPVLDKLAATFALGDADAAKPCSEARRHDIRRPHRTCPTILKDAKKSAVLPRQPGPGLRQGACPAARSTRRRWRPSSCSRPSRSSTRRLPVPQGGRRARPDAEEGRRRDHRPAAGRRARPPRSATRWSPP